MSRNRIALVVLPAALLLVLIVGLTRGTNESADDDDAAPGTREELEETDGWLQPVREAVEVPADGDCNDAGPEGGSTACQGYQVGETEVAWLITTPPGADAPTAEFLVRESPTSYTRVLFANGARRGTLFERVNVSLDDLTGDGGVEAIYGYHQDNDMSLDIVSATGEVVGHLDLGNSGQVMTGNGMLITFRPEGDGWRREELQFPDGELKVLKSEHIAGPVEGNL